MAKPPDRVALMKQESANTGGDVADQDEMGLQRPLDPAEDAANVAGVAYQQPTGGGANSKHDEGLGVEASLGANATWRLRFQMPHTLPTGTGKLRLLALAVK